MFGIHRLSLLTLCVLVAGVAQAGIEESGDWLVQRREHNFIKRLVDYTGAPEKLKEGQVYVLVDAGAAYVTVHVVGPLKSDARVYARILDDWSPTDAVYSQENDYAAASTSIKRNAWFQTRASTDVDVDGILRRVKGAGLRPYAGIV